MTAGRRLAGLSISMLAAVTLALGVVAPASAGVPSPSPAPSASPTAAVAPFSVTQGKVPTPDAGASNTGAPSTDLGVVRSPASVDLQSSLTAKSFDLATATPISYSSNETVYRAPDGSVVGALSPTPVNVERPDGSWVPSNTKVSALAQGGYAVADNVLSPSFGTSTGSGADLTVNNGSGAVTLQLLGSAKADARRPTLEELRSAASNSSQVDKGLVASAVVFPGVQQGQDLLYQVKASEVKETLVIASAPADGQAAWTWQIHAPGLTMKASERSSVYLVDGKGTVQYNIPDPVMWDSSGKAEESEPAIASVPFSFRQAESGDWLLTLTPDASWLSDPSRVYPVAVDPTLSTGITQEISYENAGPTWSNQGRMGNSRVANGDTYWHTFACYPYASLVQGYELTGGYMAYTYRDGTASTQPGYIYNGVGYSYSSYAQYITSWTITNTSGGTTDAGLPNQYQTWDNGNGPGGCLMFIGNEVAGSYTYKDVDTQLFLYYQAAPTAVPTAPANGVRGPEAPILNVTSNDPSGAAQNFQFQVSTNSNPSVSPIWTGTTSGTTSAFIQVPRNKLAPGTTYYWWAVVTDEYGAVRDGTVWSFVANSPGAISGANATPSDRSIVTTLTPTFGFTPTVPTGTDANGDALTYQFRVTTGSDVVSGQVVSSAPGTSLSWTIDPGILRDGTAYAWTVIVKDGYDNSWSWVNHFTVNLRVANPGAAPTDPAGPVTVNLANGNVSASFAAPSVNTLGGPIGLSFNYNSEASDNAGLVGSYYNAIADGASSAVFTFPPANPVQLQRTDSQISFDWSTAPPTAGFPAQNFMAQWTGFITPPAAGNYTFGFLANDTAALFLNGSSTPTLNQTTTTGTTVVWASSATTMAAGPEPIGVQYTDATSAAHLELWVKYGAVNEIVPATWLTKTVQGLPSGWSTSQGILGSSVAYVSEHNNGGSITFTDTAGASHTFTQTTGGTGYTPPAGETGIISVGSGTVNLTDGAGTVYLFNAAGQLVSATSPSDVNKPATPVPAYNSQGQLISLSDPLSLSGGTYGRQVVYAYANATNTAGGGACAAPPGLAAAPAGMLCQISYPDASTVQMYYDTNSQLAEIVGPGGATSDFGYTQVGGRYLLNAIRNPLAHDWLAHNGTVTPSNLQNTTLQYDGSGRAISVTLPAPDGVTSASRPSKQYVYASGTSYVSVAGLTVSTVAPSDGYARTVTFDSLLQELTDSSALGSTATNQWSADSRDDLLWTVNPQSIKSTTIYDSQDRPVQSYGPAPSTCYSGQTPSASCSVTLAHSTSTYDGGLTGLAAAYYNTVNLSGAPVAFGLGVGVTGGAIDQNWTGSPAAGVNATNWSLRLSGLITFPTTGTYTFALAGGDIARLYIDDVLQGTASTGIPSTSTFTPADTTSPHRIQIDYGESSGSASLSLKWTPPGGSSVDVPGTALSPNYGLVTATHSDESVPTVGGISSSQVSAADTATSYGASPWLGQVASSTIDPGTGHLNLTSGATYETGSSLYGRELTSTKPAGFGTQSTNSYYGATQSYGSALGISSPVCGLPVSTPQYGMLETSTGPTNSTGGFLAVTTIYDVLGRIVGQKSIGDSDWTCTTYDARDRVASVSYNGASRVVTNGFTSDGTSAGDPLTTWSSDSSLSGTPKIITVSDLLGRTTQYTDVWGTVTTPTYEALTSRVTSIATTPPAGGTAKTVAFTYDIEGKVLTETVDGASSPTATAAYNATQLLQSVNYSNGASLASISRDPTGATSGIGWSFASGTAVSDAVVRSQTGRILQDTLTDGTANTSTYTYDAAGRLTQALIPGHTLSYAFAATGGCGADAAAGTDGNRTGYTDAHGSSTTTVAYCYDNADRLTATTVTNPPTGADTGNTALSLTSPATLSYDAHGNTTTLNDETLSYDSSNRHTQNVAGTTTLVYKRDATDRIVERDTVISGATTAVVRYLYSGSGDAPWGASDGTGALTQRTVAMPGGAMMLINTGSPGTVWSYPNLHGDEIVTADNAGTRAAGHALYDPFGQPTDPVTGNIGTTTADDAVPNTSNGTGADDAWVGGFQKLYEHTGTVATVEMGARQYVPALGRFLSVDPIPGGNANAYNYPNNPLSSYDLTGRNTELTEGGDIGQGAREEDASGGGSDEWGRPRTPTPPKPKLPAKPVSAASKVWSNVKLLAQHFADHGAEVGAQTPEEYAQMAADFYDEAPSQGFLTKPGRAGGLKIYDPSTNTFGVYDSDGSPITFFKPSSPTYWSRQ